jgi:hypothetical protein
VPSSSPYSFIAAPHPALLTTTGASPGIEVITRHASRRASSMRPAWTCSAPQHAPVGPGRAIVAPAARITVAVARCVSRIHASITHPVKSHASVAAAVATPAESISRRRRLRARNRGRPARFGTRCNR